MAIPKMFAKDGDMTYTMEFINRKQAILTIKDNRQVKERKEVWTLVER